jgi:hypothetical protein
MATDQEPGTTEITRRTALRGAAGIGATAVWAVPAIQVVGMSAAHADSPSVVGGQPPTNGGEEPGGGEEPEGEVPEGEVPQGEEIPEAGEQPEAAPQLAQTGASDGLAAAAATGAALVGLGAAATYVARRPQETTPQV